MSAPSLPTLKGYELVEQIGQGAFGAIYRARQPFVDREVVIKIILPEHASHPDFIRRFEVEAQLVAQLEHLYCISSPCMTIGATRRARISSCV
jgi:serine/threonine protein kinase